MRSLDRAAILAGALAAVALDLPLTIIGQLLVGADGEPALLVFVFLTAVLLGFAFAGYVAATRALDNPSSNGAVSALVAFAIIQVIALLSRSLRGEDLPGVSNIAFNSLLALGSGLLGTVVAARSGRTAAG